MENSRSGKLVLLGLAVVLTLAFASAASAQPGEFVNGVLQPLRDGFPNRPILTMVIDEPGSGDSIYVTQLLESARKLSPVTLTMEHRKDFSTFGTWEAVAWINDQGDQGKAGYICYSFTLPGNAVDLLAVDMKTEAGVDMEDFNPLISSEENLYFWTQRANAPWGDTMQQFLDYAKNNPNTVRYISGGPGSGQDAAVRWYMKNFGFTLKEIIGGGSTQRALMVAAGEGDVTLSRADLILPHFQSGKVKVLMVSGSIPSPPPWESAPTSMSLGLKEDPFSHHRGIATSAQAPESHRAWLQRLFSAAARGEEFIAKRKRIPGLIPVMLYKDAILKIAKDAMDFTIPVYKEQGIYWPDKKK